MFLFVKRGCALAPLLQSWRTDPFRRYFTEEIGGGDDDALMAFVPHLQKAIEYLNKARQDDEAKNFPSALKNYETAFDYFMVAIKCTQNGRARWRSAR